MTNDAYHRLCNEWRHNWCNDALKGILADNGCEYDEFEGSATFMKNFRSACKREAVWLQDKNESDFYIELMPWGGYNGNYAKIKAALKKYRELLKLVTSNQARDIILANYR